MNECLEDERRGIQMAKRSMGGKMGENVNYRNNGSGGLPERSL